jgi:hypothetical protein
MRASSRRKATIRPRSDGSGLSHLDLENLVVALLANSDAGWPNTLYSLGYRLLHVDVPLVLVNAAAVEGKQTIQARPDAVAHHSPRNLSLVIECKTGRDAGLGQIPEGMSATADHWASALALPRGTLVTAQVRGLIVADPESLEPKAEEIERVGTSWLRVSSRAFELRPDNTGDPRLAPGFARLPPSDWPRSFIPFSHDTSAGLGRVVAAIAPLILAAAYRGNDGVTADEVARTTHEAVWAVTSLDRHKSWVGAVAQALQAIASGPLKKSVTYDKALRRLRLLDVHPGIPASLRSLTALQRAFRQEQRRTQRARTRVATRRGAAAPQLVLWADDFD